MLLALQNAVRSLLAGAFPDVFGGGTPPVTLEFPAHDWTFDASSADPVAGSPSQDDAQDTLAFNPAAPAGPYLLSRPPYAGPKRVYLLTPAKDRQPLGPSEVQWDPVDARRFTLQPAATRVLASYDHVLVLYGVTAVFTLLKSAHQLPVVLVAGDDAAAERAQALALAALALNREQVMKGGAATVSGGDYAASTTIKTLKLRTGGATAGTWRRTLVMEAEVELKVSRALHEDEGKPILHILSPGKAAGAKPVDVDVGVES